MHSIKRAIQLVDEGNIDEAITLLNKFVKTASDDEKLQVIELYYEWGFFDKAIDILEELLQKYPDESELIVTLAAMYIELENDDRAIHLLNKVKKSDPVYLQALIHLADLYQAQGLFEVSEQKLLEAKAISPDEIVIDFALGELLFSIAQYNRAIPFYERVLNNKSQLNDISIDERLAECHAFIGNYEQALTYFDKVNSEDPNMLFKYGFTAYQVNRHDIAMNTWKKLIDIDPYYHTAYYELANVMNEEGMTEEALQIAEKGLLYDEFNQELYLLAGKIKLRLNKYEQGITHIKRAIELDYDYKEAILLLIDIYKDAADTENIIEFILNIQNNGATDPLYDWELAKAYNEEELFDKAHTHYKEASTHLMHDSEFLKEYGYFLHEDGQLENAIDILTKYLQMESQDEEVMLFLQRLQFSEDDYM